MKIIGILIGLTNLWPKFAVCFMQRNSWKYNTSEFYAMQQGKPQGDEIRRQQLCCVSYCKQSGDTDLLLLLLLLFLVLLLLLAGTDFRWHENEWAFVPDQTWVCSCFSVGLNLRFVVSKAQLHGMRWALMNHKTLLKYPNLHPHPNALCCL